MIISLRKGRLGRLKPLHPWIYKRQLLKVAPSVKPGELISITNSDGKFVGRGYYNPKSEIAARILTFKDEPIDKGFFDNKIKIASAKRAGLSQKTDAYRAIFSEADGLPGLIVDVYSDTAVFQILTLGMEKFKDLLVAGIKDILNPKYIYEKSISPFRKIEGLKDESGWRGDEGNPLIQIREGKLRFLVDIVKGHKTGFYLDQRRSRLAMEQFVKGKKVLDLFCYTGPFAVSAAVYGAKNVQAVDIKREFIDLAARNADLNNVSDRIVFTVGDSFSVLRNIYNSKERFDMIIIDPPSFLKSKRDLADASRGYKELNYIAMKVLNEGGILATFSCSHNMPNEAFASILKRSASDAHKKFEILKRCHQAEDHPISRYIPETEYLKGYFLKVDSL